MREHFTGSVWSHFKPHLYSSPYTPEAEIMERAPIMAAANEPQRESRRNNACVQVSVTAVSCAGERREKREKKKQLNPDSGGRRGRRSFAVGGGNGHQRRADPPLAVRSGRSVGRWVAIKTEEAEREK